MWKNQFVQVTVQVRCGVPLSRALEQVDGLVKKLVKYDPCRRKKAVNLIICWIPLQMRWKKKLRMQPKRIVTLLEPILICIMACIVGFIMVAVLMPIYQSYAAIEAAA